MQSFNIQQFIDDLGKDLIHAFDKASNSPHPCAIGTGRENAVKKQLEILLPYGYGVGSGFVIDSYGETSKQSDIVIYEKEFVSRFAINDANEYAYYSCENVVAVGEVKSEASTNEIKDAIKKFKKIKELQRWTPEGAKNYRMFLSRNTVYGGETHSFDPLHNETDQIFTFLIAEKLPSLKIVSQALFEICGEDKNLYPNLLVSLDGRAMIFVDCSNTLQRSAINANSFAQISLQSPLAFFISFLCNFMHSARTVGLNHWRYVKNQEQSYQVEDQVKLGTTNI